MIILTRLEMMMSIKQKKKDEDPKPTIEELMAHDYFNEIRDDAEYKAAAALALAPALAPAAAAPALAPAQVLNSDSDSDSDAELVI
jgi:hypothetical protein